jgi:hypothetical protein
MYDASNYLYDGTARCAYKFTGERDSESSGGQSGVRHLVKPEFYR